MESRKASTISRGMTLMEVLVVMGLIAIVGTFGLMVSMDNYRAYGFHADRDSFLTALYRARAQAAANVCLGATCTTGKPHGLSIQPNQYVVFQGTSYATRDATYDVVFEGNPNVSHSGLSEVVFTQLSSVPSAYGDINLSDTSGHVSTVTVGSEGQIFWSN